MSYTKTTWVNNQEPSIDADNLNNMEQGIYDAQYPDSGTTGQFLKKSDTGVEWDDITEPIWGNITGDLEDQTDLQDALDEKVDVESGKGLSTNDYTDAEKTKLAGIATGAEVNVLEGVQVNGSDLNITDKKVNVDLTSYSLISETGKIIDLEIDSSTYELTAKLYDKNNNLISTSSTIDLPIEQLVVNVTYDTDTKELVITLKNGTTTRVSLSSIISSLATEDYVDDAIDDVEAWVTNQDYATNTALTTGLAGKKNTQTAVSDPTASGNTLSFIDTIAQDAQGVITPTKKTVTVDTAPVSGSTNPVTGGALYNTTVNITSSVETSTTAAYAHATDEYFWLNNVLYIASADIAVGDTITVGTNCTAVTVTDELTDLNDAISQKQNLLTVAQSIGADGYLYNNYYSVS